jgi:hypothetical protein
MGTPTARAGSSRPRRRRPESSIASRQLTRSWSAPSWLQASTSGRSGCASAWRSVSTRSASPPRSAASSAKTSEATRPQWFPFLPLPLLCMRSFNTRARPDPHHSASPLHLPLALLLPPSTNPKPPLCGTSRSSRPAFALTAPCIPPLPFNPRLARPTALFTTGRRPPFLRCSRPRTGRFDDVFLPEISSVVRRRK